MNDAATQAQTIVDKIRDMPLWKVGRAANFISFEFGAQRTVVGHTGKEQHVGDWALDVQCAWRLTNPVGIEVAYRDIYYPASTEGEVDLEQFDWDRHGKNQCDEKLAKIWVPGNENRFIVAGAKVGRNGFLVLDLRQCFLNHLATNLSMRRMLAR
jgi:hypothetical protein